MTPDLTALIDTPAARTPQKTALRWQGGDISYAELARRIELTAGVQIGRAHG